MRTASPRLHVRDDGTANAQRNGICYGEDPELFFPTSYDEDAQDQINRAKAICQNCPARTGCLDGALASERQAQAESRYGIRGGLTPYERAERAGVTTGRKHRKQVTA